MLDNKNFKLSRRGIWLKKAIVGHWFRDMPITCIIFCRAMTSEVEEAKA
jgi:hypothetical protein